MFPRQIPSRCLTQSPQPRHPTQRVQSEFLSLLPEQPCLPWAPPARARSLRAAQAFPPPAPTHLPLFSGTESLRIPPSASLYSKSPHPRRRTSRFPHAARKTLAPLLPLLRIPLAHPHRANLVPAPVAASTRDLLPSRPLVSRAGFRMPLVATRHQSVQVQDAPQLHRQNFHWSLLQSVLRALPLELVRTGHVASADPFP